MNSKFKVGDIVTILNERDAEWGKSYPAEGLIGQNVTIIDINNRKIAIEYKTRIGTIRHYYFELNSKALIHTKRIKKVV